MALYFIIVFHISYLHISLNYRGFSVSLHVADERIKRQAGAEDYVYVEQMTVDT